jgi:hypothetical protein
LKLLAQLLRGYVALADLPPSAFIEELLELYPDAKVVLVHRNPQRWWESCQPILKNDSLLTRFLYIPLPGLRWYGYLGPCYAEWFMTILGPGANPSAGASVLGPGFMDKHAGYIRRVVPKERLLEMELGQGWGPLCEFLGKPTPKDVPFPMLNEATALVALHRKWMQRGALAWLGIFTTAGLVGYVGWRLWLSRR